MAAVELGSEERKLIRALAERSIGAKPTVRWHGAGLAGGWKKYTATVNLPEVGEVELILSEPVGGDLAFAIGDLPYLRVCPIGGKDSAVVVLPPEDEDVRKLLEAVDVQARTDISRIAKALEQQQR